MGQTRSNRSLAVNNFPLHTGPMRPLTWRCPPSCPGSRATPPRPSPGCPRTCAPGCCCNAVVSNYFNDVSLAVQHLQLYSSVFLLCCLHLQLLRCCNYYIIILLYLSLTTYEILNPTVSMIHWLNIERLNIEQLNVDLQCTEKGPMSNNWT